MPLNSQFATLISLASQPASTASSVNFSDVLASAQAESATVQDGTDYRSLTGQPFQTSSQHSFIATDQSSAASSVSAVRSMESQASESQASSQRQTSLPGQDSLPNHEAAANQPSNTAPDPTAASENDSINNTASASATDRARQSQITQDQSSQNQTTATQTLVSQAGPGEVDCNSDIPGSATATLTVLTAAQSVSQPASSVAASSADTDGNDSVPVDALTSGTQKSPVAAPASIQAGGVAQGRSNHQTASASAAGTAEPGPTILAPAGAGMLKAPDKAKNSKETGRAENKASAAGGLASAVNDPSLLPAQAVAAATSNSANAANTGAIASQSSPAPNNHAAHSAGAYSDLAFALKIQGNNALTDSANPATPGGTAAPGNSDSNISAAASAFATELGGAGVTAEPKIALKSGSSLDSGPGVTGSINTLAVAAGQTGYAGEDGNAATAEEAAAPAAIPEEQAANGQAVKTVQVQITGASDQKVDLKLVEKSGALTMSVRSSDGALTKALQQNLPDLTGKLSDQQIRAEWWRPDAAPTESKNSNGSSSNGNQSAGQDQGSQNKGNSGQQGGRGTPQPAWLEDLSISRKTNSNTNNQNGTQFSWHL